MDAKQIEGFIAAAKALVEMATTLGKTTESLIASLTPAPEDAEFGPCPMCGKEGPVITYRLNTGLQVRRIWCGSCSKR